MFLDSGSKIGSKNVKIKSFLTNPIWRVRGRKENGRTNRGMKKIDFGKREKD